MLRFIDLFAGIGGFHHALAAQPIGAKCVMTVELDRHCREVYQTSLLDGNELPEEFQFVQNIRSLTRKTNGVADRPLNELAKLVPDHEILCGGFPCQPFSKSGKQEGTADETRGTLFFDIMRIVKAKRPKYIILENVPNLVGPKHFDTTWRTIVKQLRRAGYLVSDRPAILSPHELSPNLGGTPQVRKRLFILATRNDNDEEQPELTVRDYLDSIGTYSSDQWNISNFLRPNSVKENHLLREDEKMWLRAWQHFVEMIPQDNLPGFPIWERDLRKTISKPNPCPQWKLEFLRKNKEFYLLHKDLIDHWRTINWSNDESSPPITVRDFPDSRRKFEWQARSFQPVQANRDLFKLLIQFRPSGIRVKAPTYVPALVAITQTTVLGSELRRITPQEAAVLQGFPPTIFENTSVEERHMYKQLGNAVPVGLVKFCAQWLLSQPQVS
jgi:DNA (cytosine-5)-methyltransferase 1